MSPIQLLLAFFATVFAAVTAAGYLYLRPASGPKRELEPEASVLFEPISAADEFTPGTILAGIGEQVGSRKDVVLLRSDLMAAGYRAPEAVAIFNGAKVVLGVLLGLMLGLVTFVLRDDFSFAIIGFCGGAGIGYLLPDRFLEWRIVARRNRIREAVPPALDLMVMSVEAGQSINQAILDTANEFKVAYPDLSGEFSQVNLELRAGKSRADALYRLGQRNREPELKRLVSMLIDADRFGTSLAPAMRTHARYLRTRIRQQAQERARKVAVKLVFPIFLLIFPSILLVTLGPAVIRMVSSLKFLAGS